MPRSGYDMGKHSSDSGTRSAGGSASSSSQKQKSSGAKKGGKSEGSRATGHGSSESRQSSYGYYS
ncbi:hypothetical protein PspLS_06474 [Pyricularia sp. CBS 133598]|nr:hypothetical protein PspLS_06474 [Pyricularia sp. CBS 133598]